MGDFIWAIFAGCIVGASGMVIVFVKEPVIFEKDEAIQQCEAELPRHQHCDYRIEAFVVEGE